MKIAWTSKSACRRGIKVPGRWNLRGWGGSRRLADPGDGMAPPEINLIDIDRAFGPFVCLHIVQMLVLFFPGLATALP